MMPSDSVENIDTDTTVAVIESYLLDLQKCICHAIELEEPHAKFVEDQWEYRQGGGGVTRVLAEGNVIEKAGVNFSHVYGKALPKAATENRPELIDTEFQALGVSVVVHPANPYVPTSHMNVRFIIATNTKKRSSWWFGGGFDLTPYYGFVEDCVHWHHKAKAVCDPFGKDVYSKYKKWCDEYFFLPHRNEARGIGGIFFDDLNHWGFERCFAFMQQVGNGYIQAYQPIIARRKQHPTGDAQRHFQLYRRGRYVEFNLLYDRGTLFGLQSGGRTESILMSLPPLVKWSYDVQFPFDSPEANLQKEFLIAREWV